MIINEKNFNDQSIDWYEEITKLTQGQGDDYTTGCLLLDVYDYIKKIIMNW